MYVKNTLNGKSCAELAGAFMILGGFLFAGGLLFEGSPLLQSVGVLSLGVAGVFCLKTLSKQMVEHIKE